MKDIKKKNKIYHIYICTEEECHKDIRQNIVDEVHTSNIWLKKFGLEKKITENMTERQIMDFISKTVFKKFKRIN